MPQSRASVIFVVVALAMPLGLFAQAVYAQTSAATAASDAVTARRAELEAQLLEIEKQISDQQSILTSKQQESQTLERDIAIVDANIQKTQLSIKATNIELQQIQSGIADKETTIGTLSDKLDAERASLAQIIRKTNEIDGYTIAQVILSGQDVSSFFADLDTFDSVKAALADSFTSVTNNKKATEVEKADLEDQQSQEQALLDEQKLEQQRLKDQEAKKQQILDVSKGVEAVYQKMIADSQKNAAAIRTALFTLSGSSAIPFEKAYEYAVEASDKTGVRPALILGIIKEESDLGDNVGTGNWKVDMANPRDTVPFITICKELGLDPDKMPVSKKPWYGYGGAMGPAQFIPSTWVLYDDRIAKATGHTPPNPWDPEDAFMASAILLADNGATTHTPAAERLAALRYLAGWKNATKSAYAFYGNDVLGFAATFQTQIDIINGS